MSNSEQGVVERVKDWITETESEQIDEIIGEYDPNAEIPLRGQSFRVSLSSLREVCHKGDVIVDRLTSDSPGPMHGSIQEAIRIQLSDRLDETDIENFNFDDGWSIEYVDPVDGMEIDISEPLSRHTGELVVVKGRVRRRTDPVPWFRTRHYTCRRCTADVLSIKHNPEDVVRGNFRTPYACADETCNAGGDDFVLSPRDSDKRDYQYLSVEQSPDADGSKPSNIPCWLFGEGRLTGAAAGDLVTVTGRLRLNPDSEPVEHYIEVRSVETDREDDTVEVTDDDRDRIRQMVSEMDDPLPEAASSLCPKIHGQELAKKGLVLSTVGAGIDKSDENTHTMLIGDPGTGKTRLAKAVRQVDPTARQVSATSSSDVGLTASAVKEDVAGTDQWIIRAGALSLASGGVLTIDELDKADFDIDTLNEPLSEGELSVAKAGEKVTIKTDTRVVATANPDDTKFDSNDDLDEQIGFNASVVNRFDLVFAFEDDGSNEERNRGIARASASRYLDTEEMDGEYDEYSRDIDIETLQKWVKMAQDKEVRMTPEAMQKVEKGWMTLRQPDGGVISINARRLDAVARLARAHARLHLGDVVTEEDAQAAFALVSAMLGEWGYDITGANTDSGAEDEMDGLSDKEREDVQETARKTSKSADEIRQHLRIPPGSSDAVEKIIDEERGDGLGDELSRPQTDLSRGGSDD